MEPRWRLDCGARRRRLEGKNCIKFPAGGGDPKLLAGKSGADLNFLPPPRESYLLYTAYSFRSTGRIILRNLDNGEEN